MEIPSADQVVVPHFEGVEIEGVVPQLMTFAVQLGYLHWILFGSPLVIRRGKDAKHSACNFHNLGRALDFDVSGKDSEEMALLDAILAYAGPRQSCTFMDCRHVSGGGYLHVEFYG